MPTLSGGGRVATCPNQHVHGEHPWIDGSTHVLPDEGTESWCPGRSTPGDTPQGEFVGIVDEYGTVWRGDPGASKRIGDLVQADGETFVLYLEARRV